MPVGNSPSLGNPQLDAQYRLVKQELGTLTPQEEEQIKYAVSIPGIADVIHLIPRAKITPQEMANHKYAIAHGLADPLSDEQLKTLQWKRETWLKIKQSATPEEYRRIGWYLNQIENVGDMMTAAYWGGKGVLYTLTKLGMRVRGPAAKYVGWALLAKDIADTINLFKAARVVRGTKKKGSLGKERLNPLSKESKLNRGFKLKAKIPGVPDWIEILQVTDQFLGVGISFGAIVGFANDLFFGVPAGAQIKGLPRAVKEVDQL